MIIIEKNLRINRQIRIPQVRLIDENGEQLGIVDTEDALKLAMERELDLVEISVKVKPPVCKIIDYGKFKFGQKKRNKVAKRKQTKVQLKEIKMRPKIDKHDYDFKLNHIKSFLKKGDKIKISMQFRGREMAHLDIGKNILDKVKEDLEGQILVERTPKLEGRQMIMIIGPVK